MLTAKALSTMTPEQIKSLPPEVLAALSDEQLAALQPEQLAGLSAQHLAALSPEQLLSVTGGLAGTKDTCFHCCMAMHLLLFSFGFVFHVERMTGTILTEEAFDNPNTVPLIYR